METATTTKTIRENANRVILDLSQFDLILLLFAFFYFATAPAPRDRIGRRMARQRTINLFIIFNQTVTNGRLIFDRKICILFEFQSAPKFIHGIHYIAAAHRPKLDRGACRVHAFHFMQCHTTADVRRDQIIKSNALCETKGLHGIHPMPCTGMGHPVNAIACS